MKLANVKIAVRDGLLTELTVNGIHLEKMLAGYSLPHKAGEVPQLHLDLYVDNLDLEEKCADCEMEQMVDADVVTQKILDGFGREVTASTRAPDPDAGYFH